MLIIYTDFITIIVYFCVIDIGIHSTMCLQCDCVSTAVLNFGDFHCSFSIEFSTISFPFKSIKSASAVQEFCTPNSNAH